MWLLNRTKAIRRPVITGKSPAVHLERQPSNATFHRPLWPNHTVPSSKSAAQPTTSPLFQTTSPS
eukprot:4355297-Prymnesium_polylepis.2